jgi:putative acetyltransferase
MSSSLLLRRLERQTVLLAEDAQGIAGFMSFHPPGELDVAYVRPDCAGKGVARRLHATLIQRARESGAQFPRTSASEPARRFFERQGWKVEGATTSLDMAFRFHNYGMSLDL